MKVHFREFSFVVAFVVGVFWIEMLTSTPFKKITCAEVNLCRSSFTRNFGHIDVRESNRDGCR